MSDDNRLRVSPTFTWPVNTDISTKSLAELLWYYSNFERKVWSLKDTIASVKGDINTAQVMQTVLQHLTEDEVKELASREYRDSLNAFVEHRNRLAMLEGLRQELYSLAAENGLPTPLSPDSFIDRVRDVHDVFKIVMSELNREWLAPTKGPSLSPNDWRLKECERYDRQLGYLNTYLERNQRLLKETIEAAWELNKVCPKPGGYNLPTPEENA